MSVHIDNRQAAEAAAPAADDPRELLDALLRHCIASGASDMHLGVGEPPFFRIDGILARENRWPRLSGGQMERLAEIVVAPRDLQLLDGRGALDGALTGPSEGRFRYNVFRRQNQMAIAIRRLEERIRTLEELGLPSSLYELADLRDGLVVVAGPTGSGKSTTLATLIDRINRNRSSHVITIEDPIEYLHPSQQSLVNQRQIGIDSATFQDALVASLRQDPDVILVGEIRELETIRTAITAAETGHLVLTTVHAGDCVGVIERITSVFPAEEQSGVRRQLALVLRAVVAQHLMVADGPAATAELRPGQRPVARRVIASEVMRSTPAVANLIAMGKSQQLYSNIESGTAAGMQTMDQDLARLLHQRKISERTAAVHANNPSIVQDRLARMRRTGPSDAGTGSRHRGGLR